MLDMLRRRSSALFLITALAAGCGDSSSDTKSPAEVDLLGGAGDFEGEAHQAMWRVQMAEGTTANEDLFAACDSSSTCAKILLSEYGADTYSSQVQYWDASVEPAGTRHVALIPGKQYKIKLWGQAVNAADPEGTTHPVAIWLQALDYSTNYGAATFELKATGDAYESEGFTVNAEVDAQFVINLGPGSANNGTTFYLDDVEVIEGAMPPPPSGTDLLDGMGGFDDEAAQGHWWLQIQEGADATVEYVEEAGFDGKCAKIAGNTGATNYYTQLGWADPATPGAFAKLTVYADKTYQIRARTKVVGATETVTQSAWLQPGTGAAINGWGGAPADLLFSAEATDRVLGTFTGADATDAELKINFGTATTGLTFFIDDVKLVQVD